MNQDKMNQGLKKLRRELKETRQHLAESTCPREAQLLSRKKGNLRRRRDKLLAKRA